jgi:hypothetical protein
MGFRSFMSLALASPERLGQGLDEGADLVAHPAVVAQRLVAVGLLAGQPRRVVEADVHDLGFRPGNTGQVSCACPQTVTT